MLGGLALLDHAFVGPLVPLVCSRWRGGSCATCSTRLRSRQFVGGRLARLFGSGPPPPLAACARVDGWPELLLMLLLIINNVPPPLPVQKHEGQDVEASHRAHRRRAALFHYFSSSSYISSSSRRSSQTYIYYSCPRPVCESKMEAVPGSIYPLF